MGTDLSPSDSCFNSINNQHIQCDAGARSTALQLVVQASRQLTLCAERAVDMVVARSAYKPGGLGSAGPVTRGALGHDRRRLEALKHILLESGRFLNPIVTLQGIDISCFSGDEFGHDCVVSNQMRGQKDKQVQFLSLAIL